MKRLSLARQGVLRCAPVSPALLRERSVRPYFGSLLIFPQGAVAAIRSGARQQPKGSIAAFALSRAKPSAAHRAELRGELEKPFAQGLPQPFRASRKLAEDAVEELA
jgi:hypothetical protein